jgi:hypothetical protein
MSEDSSNEGNGGEEGAITSVGNDTADSFYAEFDQLTNGGRVFHYDWSDDISITPTCGLSPEEVRERQQWKESLRQIYTKYSGRTSTVTTVDDILNQRLVPPILSTSNVTSRSGMSKPRKGRMYPPPNRMKPWKGFVSAVDAYRVAADGTNENVELDVPQARLLFFSERVHAAWQVECCNEDNEQSVLLGALQRSFCSTGLVHRIHSGTNSLVTGHPDFFFVDQTTNRDDASSSSSGGENRPHQKITIIGECKSTRNLLLPITAGALVEKYKSAYNKAVVQRQERTLHWARICHPIGQLLGYMVDNSCRYGALTSATRTYFVKIEGQDEDAMVYVSRAYFPGEKGYLRAWAYVHSLGQQQPNGDELGVPDDGKGKWLRTEKDEPTPPPKRKSSSEKRSARGHHNTKPKSTSGKRKRSNHTRNTGSALSQEHQSVLGRPLSIPWVNLRDIHIWKDSPIGCGRNGAVLKATWKGMDVALKQFDVRTPTGQSAYDTELLAYSRLQDAYGKLVPKPMFLSESPSGGVQFLALQMGRGVRAGNSTDEKIAHMSFRESLLDKLRNKYGIRHNDPHHNFVILQNKAGKDHLAMIDFEDWEDLWLECA